LFGEGKYPLKKDAREGQLREKYVEAHGPWR